MQSKIDPTGAEGRASTGIEALDEILGGGLTKARAYLIEGTPGSGKTTIALQFLLEGVRQGERGLYITLSETTAELREVARSHNWSLDRIELFELVKADGLDPEAEQSILDPSEVELGETIQGVIECVDRSRPTRVVFDSLSEMRLLAQNSLRYRRQILALKQYFSMRQCTVLMLDDRSGDPATDIQLHSVAHGVIALEQLPQEYGAERRRLQGDQDARGEVSRRLPRLRHRDRRRGGVSPAGRRRAPCRLLRRTGVHGHRHAG